MADAATRERSSLDALISPEQRKAMEELSLNLARAAVTAQGALTQAVLSRADQPIDPDPLRVGPALNEVFGSLAHHPDKLLEAQSELFNGYMELWRSAALKAAGQTAPPAVEPAKGDKRFRDEAWNEHLVFDVMKQSYLLTANFLNRLVASAEDLDPLTKRRAEFFMQMLTDAFAPTNFLMSNPVALREAIATHGKSLRRGAENFADDLKRGGGSLAIAQTDYDRFVVGENVATAPGKVIYQNEIMQLLQFDPATETQHAVPLLIFPPWINKFYIMDLRPENSLIRWLSQQGLTVFVVSWVNPGPELGKKTFADYMKQGFYEAIDQVTRQTGSKTVNTVGYCIAGTMLGSTLAHMAAKRDKRIASATFFAAQQDFSEAGDLLLFTNDEWLDDLERRMDASGGVLPGAAMADTFNALRANDLVWSFFVNNYLMGKEPQAFDLLFWNSDQTRMPKALHLFYLRNFYRDNKLAKGELEVNGVRLDLGKVKTPVYIQSSREDHIAPYRSVYKGARLFGGDVTFMMAGSGHIAGVINHPSAKKYQHWTNPELPDTVDEWMAGAEEHPGSWWPDWMQWLKPRSGRQVKARWPEDGPLGVIEDAPGSYVKVRS